MRDQLNRTFKIEKSPARIVCLVPSLTELLVDLGLESQILGVTKFCVHPEHIKQSKEVIGGTKNIKIDKIKALNPDFILANKEENVREDVEALSEEFPVYVSQIDTIADLEVLIKDLSMIFQIKEKATLLINQIQNQFSEFQTYIAEKPQLKVAYFIWRAPWMVAGNSNFINYMLELANFENVFSSSDRYPEVDIQQLPVLDYVLLSSEPFPFKEKHKDELPVDNSKIIKVDGEYFSWYGSRLVEAFSYFKQLRDKL